jgi:hypothetical protein
MAFAVLIAVSTNITGAWDVTLLRDVGKHRRFRGSYYRHRLAWYQRQKVPLKPRYTSTSQHDVISQNSKHGALAVTLSGPIDCMLQTQNLPISKVLGPSAGNSLEKHPTHSQVPPRDGMVLTNSRYKQLLQWLTPYYRNLLTVLSIVKFLISS